MLLFVQLCGVDTANERTELLSPRSLSFSVEYCQKSGSGGGSYKRTTFRVLRFCFATWIVRGLTLPSAPGTSTRCCGGSREALKHHASSCSISPFVNKRVYAHMRARARACGLFINETAASFSHTRGQRVVTGVSSCDESNDVICSCV